MDFFGSKKEKNVVAAADPIKKDSAGAVSAILKKPVVSEKVFNMESGGKYAFKVSPNANKPEIKKEVEKLYGVKVEKVNIINAKPQSVFFRGRTSYRPGFKKAVVKLAAGQKIEVLPKQ